MVSLVSRSSNPNLLVERALALIPEAEEFLPFSDAVIASSHADREKRWARSGAYATLGKRVVDVERLAASIPAIVARAQSRLQEMFALVLQALQEQQSGRPAAAAATLVAAGELEEGERRLERAEAIYRMALEMSRDLREKGPQILALRRLGRAARAAGRLDDAWEWYEQSWRLAADDLDEAGQAVACQGLGNVSDDRGDRERAREWWERGLAIARRLDDAALEWPFLSNLAILAMHGGDLARAEELLARARERMGPAGEGGAMLYWLNNRGLLQLEQGDPAAAEATFREALALAGGAFWEMTMRVNLGEALVPQGRLFEAAEEARRAEEIGIVNRLIADLVDVYLLLGSVAKARCDEEGFVFYEQALSVVHERGLPRKEEARVLHGYGLLHAACGRPAEARAYLEAARDVYQALGFARELARASDDLGSLETAAV
ncbi:MAG TPA: tetratricopeptide repeat protein [Longimicrobium sp.]|nr:tetratricopeptide repeat protein [Longimicrobium sp.]